MEHGQRRRGNQGTQATAGRRLYIHGFYGRGNSRKVRCDRVGNGHLDVRAANRGEAGWDATHAWQTRRKTHADIGSRIAVKRRVLARYRIRQRAAIEGGADPGEIEPGEVGTGGRICNPQKYISGTSLPGRSCSSLL